MRRARINRFPGTDTVPEANLQEIEARGDVNFYSVLRKCAPVLLSLTDEQLGRVMRTVIENNGNLYLSSEDEDQAFAAILVETIWKLI